MKPYPALHHVGIVQPSEDDAHFLMELLGLEEDYRGFVNDCLAEFGTLRVTGDYMDRKKDEPREKHLRRVHENLRRSLEAGFPPIIDLRSFAARPAGKDYLWNGLMGHLVAVVEVQPKLSEDDNGFWFRYADSLTGKVETGLAHLATRNFTATRRFSVGKDGSEQWEWVSDYPYLVVSSPTLRLGTDKEPWHDRTNIVLRHAVFVSPGAER